MIKLWKMAHLHMVVLHGDVSLPEGIPNISQSQNSMASQGALFQRAIHGCLQGCAPPVMFVDL
jgi:hypothetical protein